MKESSKKCAGILGAVLLAAVVLTGCQDEEFVQPTKREALVQNEDANKRVNTFEEELVLRWAPVHLQDTDVTGSHGINGKADYLSAVNYDGDWNATNNWNNLSSFAATGHCYYSVVETTTHWFIVYAFFHPRDWTDNVFLYNIDEHENDLEGYLSIVKKDGSAHGALQGIVTVAHSDFFSFVPSGSPLQANQEDIDGTLSFETYHGQPHPVTAQEAKGHGLKANPYYKINGDGLKYLPSLDFTAEAPANADDRDVKYKLVNIFEANGLWDQRFNTELFSSAAGGFKSSYGNGGANAPWAWDDGNDVPGKGELATDPAKLVNSYFKNLGTFSLIYTKNKYKGI
ncbi:hypothetical protein [Pseudochryseolinea flava]|uniref:Lipoprotein n=1 Tax=Pseudochryseolinea flava TaxID=2059302 RepID=A0A364Y040_9BACT|nr:hypothetical protein [Pseudochryseolinea flava]RAW00015.1 hypothetical protein DQQ10_15780 [Pseudochryseolinea flava]